MQLPTLLACLLKKTLEHIYLHDNRLSYSFVHRKYSLHYKRHTKMSTIEVADWTNCINNKVWVNMPMTGKCNYIAGNHNYIALIQL